LAHRNIYFNRLFFKKLRNNVFRVLFSKKNLEKFGKCFANFSKIQFVFTEIMVQGYEWEPGGEKETGLGREIFISLSCVINQNN
jgi:hypothetical protein